MGGVLAVAKGKSIVSADDFPTDDEAFLLCLTSQQISIINQMVFPYAHFRSRFVHPVIGERYSYATPEEWAAYHQVVEDLEDTLGGDAMPCSDIRAGLEAIAAALAANPPAGGCSQVVNCGGGSCMGPLGPIQDEPNENIVPQTPIEEPPQEGDPPEGFESWEAYFTRKCRAAHFLWGAIRNLMRSLEGLSGAVIVGTVVAPFVWGWVATTGVVFPPAAAALLLTYIIAVGLISEVAFFELYQAVDWWDAHKTSIVCALYTSGSAQDALDTLADAYEDAIEAIVWGGVLGPLSGALGAALSLVGSAAINTNLVNVMFEVTEDILLPDVTCPCFHPYEWGFTDDDEGWVWSLASNVGGASWEHGWTDEEQGRDGADADAGRLTDHVWGGDGTTYAVWRYNFPFPYPVAVEGAEFSIHMSVDTVQSAGCFVSIIYSDDTDDTTNESIQPTWQTLEVSVSAPNEGKSIKALQVSHFRGSGTGEMFFAWDHAILL